MTQVNIIKFPIIPIIGLKFFHKKKIIIILHPYHHKHVTKYIPEMLHNYTGNIVSGETMKKKDTNGNKMV